MMNFGMLFCGWLNCYLAKSPFAELVNEGLRLKMFY